MCGIIGFLGLSGAVEETMEGLQALEYRGYDSAGLSYLKDGEIQTIKSVGNISKLKQRVTLEDAHIAIGHTRWATHGGVTEANCHPHLSNCGRISVVHNGIIENYKEQIEMLAAHGITMKSETDTEVIPNLISLYLERGLLGAVREASKHLMGSYAFLAMSPIEPQTLVATRKGRQPLIVGKGDDFIYVSSDLPTARQKCGEIYILEQDEFCVIQKDSIDFGYRKNPLNLTLQIEKPSKGNFATWMEKEIFEIPEVIERILCEYKKIIKTQEFTELQGKLSIAKTVHIAACGTAYHAGLVLGQLLESSRGIRTRVYIASELGVNGAFINDGDFGVVVSQSGETADTLSALQLFKERGLPVLAICNVEGSSIARYSDFVLPTLAGTEIAVASTKAFIAQTLVSSIVANPKIGFATLADEAREILNGVEFIKTLARQYREIRSIFFLGTGIGAILAQESALKVKEITYKHCEGFPSGELKHGTLALVDSETLSIIINTTTCAKTATKLENARHEVAARGSHTEEFVSTSYVIGAIPAFLFSLYLSQELKLNPDQPRNLAKSVTVE